MRMGITAAICLSLACSSGCASSNTATQQTSAPEPAESSQSAEAAKPAEDTARPTIEGVSVLSWEQVSAAMQGGAMLVDARSAKGYEKGHIAGAINVPCAGSDDVYAQLPEDKSKQLIFYCGGPACAASSKAAEKASVMGYTNLSEYRGGYPEWHAMQHHAKPAQ